MITLSKEQVQVILNLMNDIEAEKGGLLETEEEVQAYLVAALDAQLDKGLEPKLVMRKSFRRDN